MATLTQTAEKPARSFYLVSGVALLWNLIGVATYLTSVTMSPDALAQLPEAQRALHESTPAWVTGAYAIAVFGGTLGCVALLLRKAWAVPVFVVSLVAAIVQFGYSLLFTPMLDLIGASAAIFPIFVIAVAGFLVWYARSTRAKGWIR